MIQSITKFADKYAPELVCAPWFTPPEGDRESHAHAMADELGYQLLAARRELANADIFEAPDRPEPTLAEIVAAIKLLARLSGDLRRDAP